MAIDIFLKLDGVTGEAQDSTHKDEIDILSWSFGESQSGTFGSGGGGGSGKVSVQDMSFTKKIDNATPTLMLFCANGKHIASGKLTNRKAGENPLEYLTYELTDIIVTGVHQGGSAGGDVLTENVTINFRKFKTVYTKQEESGSAGAAPEMSWNVAENKAE